MSYTYLKTFPILLLFLTFNTEKSYAGFDYINYVPTLTGLYEQGLSPIESGYTMTFFNPKIFYFEQKYDFHTNTRVVNTGTISDLISGYFFGLSSTENGAAISNTGTIGDITADFMNNMTTAYGSAVYNTGTIGNITGDFIENDTGTAVVYNIGNINSINGNFIKNHSVNSYAGAIFNYKTSTGVNSVAAINGDFIGNYVSSGKWSSSGAIYTDNDTGTSTISGNFIGNHVFNSYAGTTIKNLGGNSGAVIGSGLILLADGKNYEFTDNYISYNYSQSEYSKYYNAIYFPNTSFVTFNVLNNGTWTLNDNITSYSWSSFTGLWYTFAGGGTLNIIGDNTGTVIFNSELVNLTNVNVSNATLKFGAYNHNDENAYNSNSHGMFISAAQWLVDSTVPDYWTNLSLTNSTFDIANGYNETVKVLAYTSNNSELHMDLNSENLESDLLSVKGNVNGTTNVVFYADKDLDISKDESILFAESQNDTTGDENSFNIYRVYNNPYNYRTSFIAIDDTTNNWFLNLAAPEGFVAEVPAYIGLQNATTEQMRDLTLVARKNTVRGGNKRFNTWAAPVYFNSETKQPTNISSSIAGAEAGIDINTDIGKLGIMGSFRNGRHDLTGQQNIASSKTGSTIDMTSFGGGVYHRYDEKELSLFSSIYGGGIKADIKTDDGFITSTNGYQISAATDINYRLKLSKKWRMYPGFSLQYGVFKIDDINDEFGKNSSYNNWGYGETELANSFEYAALKNTSLYIKPGILYTFANNDYVTISGLGKFDTIKNKTMNRIETGIRQMLNKNLSGYFYGDYTTNYNDYSAMSFGLGFGYKL